MVRVCLRVKDMGGNVLEGDRLSADVSDKFHQWNPTPRPLGGTKKEFLLLVDAKKTLARQILVKNVGAAASCTRFCALSGTEAVSARRGGGVETGSARSGGVFGGVCFGGVFGPPGVWRVRPVLSGLLCHQEVTPVVARRVLVSFLIRVLMYRFAWISFIAYGEQWVPPRSPTDCPRERKDAYGHHGPCGSHSGLHTVHSTPGKDGLLKWMPGPVS